MRMSHTSITQVAAIVTLLFLYVTAEQPRRLRFNRRLSGKFQPGDEPSTRTEELRAGTRPKFETLQRMDPRLAFQKLKNTTIGETIVDSLEELETMLSERSLWFWDNENEYNDFSDPYTVPSLADPSVTYDSWSQAYRMLGGYIDCDRPKGRDGNSHDSKDNNGDGCARWMVWAAYVDPYYSGGGYDEYHNNDNGKNRVLNQNEANNDEAEGFSGNLNCHEKNTHWELLGIYRQEFYQYVEQISKHLWAINDYNYITTVGALAYMTKNDCFQVGNADDGSAIYAGVQPLSGGDFQMRLYLESQCLYAKDSDLGLTYDDFANANGNAPYYDDAGNTDTWYSAAQEYTLTNVNAVFDTYRTCTLCMDYPTYQDGYLIGDTGMDEDDVINQCWKFHSHDSFVCDSNCLELAHAQGSIKFVQYNGIVYGGVSSKRATNVQQSEQVEILSTDSLKANIFLTLSSILFVACFLSYLVARNSSKRRKRSGDEKSSKSRRLLEKGISRSSSRPRSRSRSSNNLVVSSKTLDKSVDETALERKRSDRVRRSLSRSKHDGDHDERLPRRQRSSQAAEYQPPSLDRNESRRIRSSSDGREMRKSRSKRSSSGRE